MISSKVKLTDSQINDIWKNLPGIEIHNQASKAGVSTDYALRIAFARALESHSFADALTLARNAIKNAQENKDE